MTEYISDIKTIPFSNECVFSMLSDLSNLERVKDRIPKEHIKELSFDRNSCSLEISPVGKVEFQIVDREPHKTIKFGTTNSPVALFLWIQLKPTEENVTKMKLTIHADMNPLLKTMVSKPVQEGLDKLADALAMLPYA
ncbi:MAG: SRPBCC family protein [Tannerella sp.]|jgi:carbon monoxide dehydrogenase subunit G|nr:SRPBCC family protein [Tannerella sp.]